jgi:DNA polymerase-1
MSVRRHLVLVDGDNLVHRIFHAPSYQPPADRFGFALGRLRKACDPSHMVVVWDPVDDGPRWRRKLWPDYKKGRDERPEELDDLFRDARAICVGWRTSQARIDMVEADDLIASYVEAGVGASMDVTIVSADKDMLQLVRDAPVLVRMRDDVRNVVWGPSEVLSKFGVEPTQFADYLALVGDASDGFPGVPGIGPKKAVGLLKEYGCLDNVLANAPLVRSTSTMKALLSNAHLARVCLALARLRSDVDLPVELDSTAIGSATLSQRAG